MTVKRDPSKNENNQIFDFNELDVELKRLAKMKLLNSDKNEGEVTLFGSKVVVGSDVLAEVTSENSAKSNLDKSTNAAQVALSDVEKCSGECSVEERLYRIKYGGDCVKGCKGEKEEEELDKLTRLTGHIVNQYVNEKGKSPVSIAPPDVKGL